MLYGSVEYFTPSAHTVFFSSEPICYLQDSRIQIFWSNQNIVYCFRPLN